MALQGAQKKKWYETIGETLKNAFHIFNTEILPVAETGLDIAAMVDPRLAGASTIAHAAVPVLTHALDQVENNTGTGPIAIDRDKVLALAAAIRNHGATVNAK